MIEIVDSVDGVSYSRSKTRGHTYTKIDLATNKEVVIPDGKNIKTVDVKTLQPHGTGNLQPHDKTSIQVNYQDNHVLSYVDPVTNTVTSSTVFPDGTTRTSINPGMSNPSVISKGKPAK